MGIGGAGGQQVPKEAGGDRCDSIRFDGTPAGAWDVFDQFDILGAKFVPGARLCLVLPVQA